MAGRLTTFGLVIGCAIEVGEAQVARLGLPHGFPRMQARANRNWRLIEVSTDGV